MRRQRPELVKRARVLPLPDDQLREPLRVELPRLQPRLGLGLELAAGHHQPARDRHVLIDRLTRDQQVHDLARPLKDPVDAEVAHHRLARHRLLAPRLERRRRLAPTPTTDLNQIIDHLPAQLRPIHLRDRSLDPDVVALVIRQPPAHIDHRLQPKRAPGDKRDLLRHLIVLADRPTPLHPLITPLTT